MDEQIKEPLKLGFVGAGFAGQKFYVSKFSKVHSCETVALADSRSELRWKVAQKYGLKKAYSNHQEMLEDANIDAVVVAFQDSRSAPVILDCLGAGKHVLCAAPMAHSLDQAYKLMQFAQRKNLIFSVACSKRYDENILRVKSMMSDLEYSRELGKIVYVKAHCFIDKPGLKEDYIFTDEETSYPPGSNWPVAPDWLPRQYHESFSSYLCNYCEIINLVRFLIDFEPAVKYADMENPCAQIVSLKFDSVSGIIETGTGAYRHWDEFIELYYEKGRMLIKTNPPSSNLPAEIVLYKNGFENKIKSINTEGFCSLTAQAEAFVNDILKGRPPVSSASDSLSDLKIMEKIWMKQFNKKK
jgi:predicted dehydrogenase